MGRVTTKQETEKDAMSEVRTFRISIPQFGSDGLDAALHQLEAFASKKQLTIKEVKKIAVVGDKAKSPKLSKESFFYLAGQAIADAERLLDLLPEQYRKNAALALEKAFQAGIIAKEAVMRDKHLRDVTREEGQKKARRDGGLAPKTEKETTIAVVKSMDILVHKGMRISSAADCVHRQNLGKSADANRKLYAYWKKTLVKEVNGENLS